MKKGKTEPMAPKPVKILGSLTFATSVSGKFAILANDSGSIRVTPAELAHLNHYMECQKQGKPYDFDALQAAHDRIERQGGIKP